MDFDENIKEFGPVNIFDLLGRVRSMSNANWQSQIESRKKLAGNRPGNAVFFINDSPASCPRRNLIEEARGDAINVLYYKHEPLFQTIENIVNTQVRPFFKNALPMRVQLASLPPGEKIAPHKDIGILTKIHRLHIPIITSDNVHFYVKQNRYHLKTSHLYELNNAVVHSVYNQSDIERVHLLIDMLPNEVGGIKVHLDEESHFKAVTKH